MAPGRVAQGLQENQEKSVEQAAKELSELKQRRKDARQKSSEAPENEADYTILVCFNSNKEKEDFLRKHRLAEGSKVMSFPEMEAALLEGAGVGAAAEPAR